MSNYKIKLILTGDYNVGKSSILTRYVDDKFDEFSKTTIGVDYRSKSITVNSSPTNLQLWDTAGHDRFQSIVTIYYKHSDIFFIVFNVADKTSFENCNNWIQKVKQYMLPHSKIILVGNCIDLEKDRIISYNTALKFAQYNNIDYYECSAKKNINITEMFNKILNKCFTDQLFIEAMQLKINHNLDDLKIKKLNMNKCCYY